MLAQLLARGLDARLAVDALRVDGDEERLALLLRLLEGPDERRLPVDVGDGAGAGAGGGTPSARAGTPPWQTVASRTRERDVCRIGGLRTPDATGYSAGATASPGEPPSLGASSTGAHLAATPVRAARASRREMRVGLADRLGQAVAAHRLEHPPRRGQQADAVADADVDRLRAVLRRQHQRRCAGPSTEGAPVAVLLPGPCRACPRAASSPRRPSARRRAGRCARRARGPAGARCPGRPRGAGRACARSLRSASSRIGASRKESSPGT